MWEWESLDAMHLHALLWTLFIGLLIRSSGTASSPAGNVVLLLLLS